MAASIFLMIRPNLDSRQSALSPSQEIMPTPTERLTEWITEVDSSVEPHTKEMDNHDKPVAERDEDLGEIKTSDLPSDEIVSEDFYSMDRSPAIEGGARNFSLADAIRGYEQEQLEWEALANRDENSYGVELTSGRREVSGLGSSSPQREVSATGESYEVLPEKGRVFNCRTNLMVRTRPTRNSSFIGRLPCRDRPTVEILDRTDNGWYKINYDGREAYVYGGYIELLEATEKLVKDLDKLNQGVPVVEAPHPDECALIGVFEDCDEDLLPRGPAQKTRKKVKDPHPGNWREGCELLKNQDELDDQNNSQVEELQMCINSIQNAITQNGRDMNRQRVFERMYTELNPIEQKFAAMVFTAQGEAVDITTPNTLEEMLIIMKVIDNRVTRANQRRPGHDYTHLDIVLDPYQFSMYNANDNNWSTRVNPNVRNNFSNAIRSYMQFPHSTFEPEPHINHVYHYHVNYVLPQSWGQAFLSDPDRFRVDPVVNGKNTRLAPSGFNERSASDRAQIKRSFRRVRHRFYVNIDSQGRTSNLEDGWSRNVQRPWRP